MDPGPEQVSQVQYHWQVFCRQSHYQTSTTEKPSIYALNEYPTFLNVLYLLFLTFYEFGSHSEYVNFCLAAIKTSQVSDIATIDVWEKHSFTNGLLDGITVGLRT